MIKKNKYISYKLNYNKIIINKIYKTNIIMKLKINLNIK